MCLIAIIVHIYDNDVLNCDNLYTSHVDDIFTHFVSLMKVWGWKTILLDRPTRWVGKKTLKNVSKDQILLYENTLFCVFFENFQYWQFWSTNFSMKTPSTEKMEHTTTTATENPRNLSSQIFYFWTFVTEIFQFKWRHFSFFWKFKKTQIVTNLAAELRVLPEHLDQSK